MKHTFLVNFVLVGCLAIPTPQTEDEAPGVTDITSNNLSEETLPVGDNEEGVEALFKFAVDLGQGFLALLGEKVKFTNRLLADQEFQESVGDTVDASLNLTGQLTRAAIPVAKGVLEVVPGLVKQGSRFAGSVLNAANDTLPLIKEGIDEFTAQLPLIAQFATAYAEVNAEQGQVVLDTFSRSLTCNNRCRDLAQGSLERISCEEEFCQKVEVPELDFEV